MLARDRGEEPAELFVVLQEGPQGALPAHEAGLLVVFVGPAVTELQEFVGLVATELWVYADLAVVVW